MGDAADLFAMASSEAVAQFMLYPPYPSREHAEGVLERWIQRGESGEPVPWAITLRGEDRLIGRCGYSGYSPAHRRGRIAYDLSEAYWGRGIMPEAVRLVTLAGMTQLDLNRVEAWVIAGNRQSEQVLRKNNYRLEATMRHAIIARGQPYDALFYAVLRADLEPLP